MKKVLAIILTIVTVFSIVSISAFAEDNTNYGKYNEPESSGDYAYWNGSKVVKSSSTTNDEIKWMQAALNFCKKNIGLSFSSYLAIDGSFGPASKSATLAFQKKYGLSQDGSFGPATIQKMKTVLDDYKKSQNKTTTTKTANTNKSKTLSINMNVINQTGPQPYSGPCGCFAVAYCRDILDGKAHKWTEFNNGGTTNTAVWSKAKYESKNGSSKQAVLKACYDNINNNKPVVVRVTGNGSSGHYITVVGYTNVTNVNSLSEKNFKIIDPVKSAFAKGVRTMTDGSTGYSIASSCQYIVSK